MVRALDKADAMLTLRSIKWAAIHHLPFTHMATVGVKRLIDALS